MSSRYNKLCIATFLLSFTGASAPASNVFPFTLEIGVTSGGNRAYYSCQGRLEYARGSSLLLTLDAPSFQEVYSGELPLSDFTGVNVSFTLDTQQRWLINGPVDARGFALYLSLLLPLMETHPELTIPGVAQEESSAQYLPQETRAVHLSFQLNQPDPSTLWVYSFGRGVRRGLYINGSGRLPVIERFFSDENLDLRKLVQSDDSKEFYAVYITCITDRE